jgi:predicted permease
MDIIDLFLFGGIVGSVVYYWALFKTLFDFKRDNYLGWFLVGMFFFIGGIAGHFFASGVNALYLVIVCYFLQNSTFLKEKQMSKCSISVAPDK